MSVSENDLELLEEHLDGTLDAPATVELTRRLSGDVELSAALHQAKAHRAIRSAVWQSIEPDKSAADRLLWRVRGAMLDQTQNLSRKQTHKSGWESWKIASFGSAAAACLLVGFLVGRVGSVGQPNLPQALLGSSTGGGSGGGNSGGGTLAVNDTTTSQGQFNRVGTVPKVLVPISNEYGTVTWQPFDNAEQAASFEADLHKAQSGTMSPAPTVAPKLASQEQEHF